MRFQRSIFKEVTPTDLTYTATRDGRLSAILKEDMSVSSGLMNRAKWAGNILVNGTAQHTDFPVRSGDTVTVLMPESPASYTPEDGPLDILYEDADILAVDKPAGMLIHPSRSCNSGTLANVVAGYLHSRGEPTAFHPLTRLDRDTFGIVLIAKNSHIHALLQKAQVHKTYRALCFGAPSQNAGIIDAPIARLPLPSLLRQVSADGKPCITNYTVLGRYDGYSLLSLQPITGRTHQLRVHCAYMGFPILGDPQYASAESRAFSEKMGLSTQLLCAHSLEFFHPITGKLLHLQSHMDVI